MADPAPAFTAEHRRRLEHLADPEGVRILSVESHAAIRAALVELDHLTLRWQDEPPTEPGWYWYRQAPGNWGWVCNIWYSQHAQTLATFFPTDIVRHVAKMGGQWAGPIPLPVEPTAQGPGEEVIDADA